MDRPGGENDDDHRHRHPGDARDVWPGSPKERLARVEQRRRGGRCGGRRRGRRRGWSRGADGWDVARELLGCTARRIGGRLVIVSEKKLVDRGADRRLLDHRAAADLAAYPAGPELPRLILIDHELNLRPGSADRNR